MLLVEQLRGNLHSFCSFLLKKYYSLVSYKIVWILVIVPVLPYSCCHLIAIFISADWIFPGWFLLTSTEEPLRHFSSLYPTRGFTLANLVRNLFNWLYFFACKTPPQWVRVDLHRVSEENDWRVGVKSAVWGHNRIQFISDEMQRNLQRPDSQILGCNPEMSCLELVNVLFWLFVDSCACAFTWLVLWYFFSVVLFVWHDRKSKMFSSSSSSSCGALPSKHL